jgi:parallel beta-helix repeat protein
MSSPEVNGSRIMDNKHGVYVTEGATPRVTGTMISGNENGVYVTFSSYPVINRCEFAANKAYAVYLDEQSYEWVSNTGDDTRREKMGMRAAATGGSGGRAGQHAAGSGQSGSGLEREKAMSAERYVNPRGAFVDFRENHWGAVATKEMSGSGELVDTGVIYDYFDLNSDIYEGKRWVRDKADYTGYLKASPLKR